MSRPFVVSREELEAFVRERVAAAFDDPRDIARSALDLLVDSGARESLSLEAEIEEMVRAAARAHLEAQRGWPAITDCERLDRAFTSLSAQGILARQDYMCCQTCGVSEIRGEIDQAREAGERVVGFAFFHEQDTLAALARSELRILELEPGDRVLARGGSRARPRAPRSRAPSRAEPRARPRRGPRVGRGGDREPRCACPRRGTDGRARLRPRVAGEPGGAGVRPSARGRRTDRRRAPRGPRGRGPGAARPAQGSSRRLGRGVCEVGSGTRLAGAAQGEAGGLPDLASRDLLCGRGRRGQARALVERVAQKEAPFGSEGLVIHAWLAISDVSAALAFAKELAERGLPLEPADVAPLACALACARRASEAKESIEGALARITTRADAVSLVPALVLIGADPARILDAYARAGEAIDALRLP